MVAQIRARRAPGLVGEGHEGVGVPRLLDEALARVFYRGCAGLRVTNRVERVRALETSHVDGVRVLLQRHRRESRAASTAKLYAIDAAR